MRIKARCKECGKYLFVLDESLYIGTYTDEMLKEIRIEAVNRQLSRKRSGRNICFVCAAKELLRHSSK